MKRIFYLVFTCLVISILGLGILQANTSNSAKPECHVVCNLDPAHGTCDSNDTECIEFCNGPAPGYWAEITCALYAEAGCSGCL